MRNRRGTGNETTGGFVCIRICPTPWAHLGTPTGARAVPAGGPRPQHVARSRWSGAFLSVCTGNAAADRDGPRSGVGGLKIRPRAAPRRRADSGLDACPLQTYPFTLTAPRKRIPHGTMDAGLLHRKD